MEMPCFGVNLYDLAFIGDTEGYIYAGVTLLTCIIGLIIAIRKIRGPVAKLVDAPDLESGVRKDVGVRIPLSPQTTWISSPGPHTWFVMTKPLPPGLDPVVRSIVVGVAERVRAEIKTWARNIPSTWEINPENLTGCCGIASYMLKNTLAKLGFESQFVMGHFNNNGIHYDDDRNNHCWLVFRGYIFDLTITQFGYDSEVFVVSKDDDRYLPLKSETDSINTLLKSWSGQSPTRYKDSLDKIQHKLHANLQVIK